MNSDANIRPFHVIKKESPNEGTETQFAYDGTNFHLSSIKKESPNEGTETPCYIFVVHIQRYIIKKESPNEGTETNAGRITTAPSKA